MKKAAPTFLLLALLGTLFTAKEVFAESKVEVNTQGEGVHVNVHSSYSSSNQSTVKTNNGSSVLSVHQDGGEDDSTNSVNVNNNNFDITGTVKSISGTTVNISGQNVTIDSSKQGGLSVGTKVHVTGTISGGNFVANSVNVTGQSTTSNPSPNSSSVKASPGSDNDQDNDDNTSDVNDDVLGASASAQQSATPSATLEVSAKGPISELITMLQKIIENLRKLI